MAEEERDTRLDDIFDRYSEENHRLEMWILYTEVGGCSCHTMRMPPCTWCMEYDFDNDPLDLYNK